MNCEVFCDFDGTIATVDTTDALLEAYADPLWREHEAAWTSGQIGSRACLERQVELLHVADDELDAAIDGFAIDPAFPGFVDWCAARGWPVRVVSDGFARVIRHVLDRHGLGHVAVRANEIERRGRGRSAARFPWARPECRADAGLCKCAAVRRQVGDDDATVVYVGDGRSDACAATAVADLVYAKTALARHCREHSHPYVPFETFADVRADLARRAFAAAVGVGTRGPQLGRPLRSTIRC